MKKLTLNINFEQLCIICKLRKVHEFTDYVSEGSTQTKYIFFCERVHSCCDKENCPLINRS